MSAKIIRFPKKIAQQPQIQQVQRTEEKLIAHMLQSPEQAYKVMESMNGKQFRYEEHQAICTYLMGFYEEFKEANSSKFLCYLPEELRKTVANILVIPIDDF